MFISKTAKRKSASHQSVNSASPSSSAEEMSKCPKCGEPVYFAERKTILGRDWHSKCLRCDNCDRALTPGQHSAHMNKPYCNACYQAMFGPEGFRQGMVEPRKVLIKAPAPSRRDTLSKSDLKTRIKEYNLYKSSPVEKLKSRENNGQILFEGILKLYWGLKRPIILSPGAMYNRRQSALRASMLDFVNVDDDSYKQMLQEAEKDKRKKEFGQEKAGRKMLSTAWDGGNQVPEVSSEDDLDDLTVSLPAAGFGSLPNTPHHAGGRGSFNRTASMDSGGQDEMDGNAMSQTNTRSLTRAGTIDPNGFNSRSPIRKRSASFRKISKQKRIEGRANSEMRHQFTPPYGVPTSVRVTSIIPTKDVILMLMAKYKVETPLEHFSLCVFHDSGVQEYLNEADYPLQRRLKLGPNEDIAKIYVVEASVGQEQQQLPEEVQTWIKFSQTELQQFDKKFEEEMLREEEKIRKRFSAWRDALREQLQNGRTGRHETDL